MKRKAEVNSGLQEVLFISANGQVRFKNQFDCRDSEGVIMNVEEIKLMQVAGFSGSIDESPERRDSWFELMEMDVEGEDGPGLVSSSSPRSSLKLVDEALEFEMGGLADRGFS